MKVAIEVLVVVVALIAGISLEAREVDSVYTVSIVKLLADPDALADRTVKVFGYLTTEGDPMLFLTKDHAFGKDWDSAVPVVPPAENFQNFRSCGGRYVTLIGRFFKPPGEHHGYSLYDIRLISYRQEGQMTSTKCFELASDGDQAGPTS